MQKLPRYQSTTSWMIDAVEGLYGVGWVIWSLVGYMEWGGLYGVGWFYMDPVALTV